jgi:acyl CoA:acetate/3-ketoacid CoA transferase alpha subunit
MRKPITPSDAAALVRDGASVMAGGFLSAGTPHRLVDALVARGARGLTIGDILAATGAELRPPGSVRVIPLDPASTAVKPGEPVG